MLCEFLGIIFDDKLGWLDHIKSINIKLSKSLYILNSVKNMLPNYILMSGTAEAGTRDERS